MLLQSRNLAPIPRLSVSVKVTEAERKDSLFCLRSATGGRIRGEMASVWMEKEAGVCWCSVFQLNKSFTHQIQEKYPPHLTHKAKLQWQSQAVSAIYALYFRAKNSICLFPQCMMGHDVNQHVITASILIINRRQKHLCVKRTCELVQFYADPNNYSRF